jgi:hypothetical protein
MGKSLVAALTGNPRSPAVACDNFSEFDNAPYPQNRQHLINNLQKYGLSEQVKFFDCNFRFLLKNWHEEKLKPVGVYFYDGAHDEESQYQAIHLGEEVLADKAIVIIDDWRFAPDSQSFAKAGTLRAVRESRHQWDLIHELPARYNGDRAQWWNGVGVFSFRRRKRE